MKKFLLVLLGVTLLFTSCKKDNSIKYEGSDVVNIVLLEEFYLKATSNSEITYQSNNESFVTVNSEGKVFGKNVGKANVTISNGDESIVVKVIVSLFEEPTLDFGSTPEQIKDIYGNPKHNYGDSIFIYGSGNDWYSFAVWEMDFFFVNNAYIESDLYIRNDLSVRIDEFIDSKYYFQSEVNDTIYSDDNNSYEVITGYIYLNAENPEDADILIGKIYDADEFGDICLFYTPFHYNREYDFKNFIHRIKDKRKRDER